MLVLLTSSGEFGFAPGGIREGMNHLVPHVKTCSNYLGVDVDKDFYHVGIEYQEFGDARHNQSIKDAHEAILPLVEKLGGIAQGTSLTSRLTSSSVLPRRIKEVI